jgi:putative sterol carrier protein
VRTTADATNEFFDELGRRGHEPRLRRASGTLRFDLVDGTRTERWLVAMDKGDVAVSRKNAKADAVVRTDKQRFDGIVRGDVNPMTATLRSEMQAEGDSELFVLFQRLFPGRSGGGKARA